MEFLSRLGRWWSDQWRTTNKIGKLAMLVVPLFLGCCGMTMLTTLVSPDAEPTAESAIADDRSAAAAPTADSPTAEPPTSAPTDEPTPVPATATARPSATPEPTQVLFADSGEMTIVEVNEEDEYIEIRNVAGIDVMMTDWSLRFEEGNITCDLGGVGLFPDGYTLRVWMGERAPAPGEYACGFAPGTLIDNGSQLVSLLDHTGTEVANTITVGASRGSLIELPTAVPPTSAPTLAPTLAPTAVPPTAIPPTAAPTAEVFPTATLPTAAGSLVIIGVDKRAEVVTIRNDGGAEVNLAGWILRSEKGPQDCALGGVLGPGQVLQIWAMAEDIGQGGYNCGFDSDIWNNSEPDAALLIDPSGAVVSRW